MFPTGHGLFFLMLICFGFSICSGQRPGQCRVPASIPGIPVDPFRLVGTWYQYLHNTGLPETNTIATVTPLGPVAVQGSTTSSPTIPGLTVSWTTQEMLDGSCAGMFAMASFTNDGKKVAMSTWLPGATTPTSLVYSTIFTDYATMEIFTRCKTPDAAGGPCPDPMFWVFTRVDPRTMSAAMKAYVRSTANFVLTQFCTTVDKLTVSDWDDTYFVVCKPTPPTDFTTLLEAAKKPTQCKIPLNLQGQGMPVNPTRLMGTWYQYLDNLGIPETNGIGEYKPIGQVALQAQSSPASPLAVSWSVIELVNGQCSGLFAVATFSPDGQKSATVWLGSSTSAPFVYTTLFTDYTTVEIFTRCKTPNTQAGTCPDPLFWVFTRQDPRTLAQTTKDYITNAVNNYLAPFCSDVTKLQPTIWDSAQPLNCKATPPAEFTALVQKVTPSSSNVCPVLQ